MDTARVWAAKLVRPGVLYPPIPAERLRAVLKKHVAELIATDELRLVRQLVHLHSHLPPVKTGRLAEQAGLGVAAHSGLQAFGNARHGAACLLHIQHQRRTTTLVHQSVCAAQHQPPRPPWFPCYHFPFCPAHILPERMRLASLPPSLTPAPLPHRSRAASIGTGRPADSWAFSHPAAPARNPPSGACPANQRAQLATARRTCCIAWWGAGAHRRAAPAARSPHSRSPSKRHRSAAVCLPAIQSMLIMPANLQPENARRARTRSMHARRFLPFSVCRKCRVWNDRGLGRHARTRRPRSTAQGRTVMHLP